ncbi:MAG: tetratricopeptide repeat protein [Saprospiraceae bacterium]
MEKFYCILYFIILVVPLNAQNVDSLTQLLPQTKSTDAKVELILNISEIHRKSGNFPKAISFLDKGLSLNSSEETKIEMQYYKASSLMYLQKYEDAIELCNNVIDAVPRDKEVLAKTYGLLSNVKLSLGETDAAYELQYKFLELSEEIDYKEGLYLASYQIGTYHFYQNNYKLALKNYKKALKYANESKNDKHIYTCLGAIGSSYHRLQNFEQSAIYNLEGLKLAQKIGYEVGIAYAAFNVGSDYYVMEKYDTAITYILQGLELQQKQQDKWGQSSSLRMLGEAYRVLGDVDNSIKYSLEAVEIATEIEATPRIMEGYGTLARVYESKGDYEEANAYLYDYIKLKDSLANKETLEKIEEVQTNYEVAQKEREILKKNNKITKIYGFVLIGGIVILLVISWLIYSRYRSEQKANTLLAEKNKQIHQQNLQLKSNNQKIQEQNRKLENSNEELRRFAFIASHDLKEPLRNIGSYSSLLSRRYKGKLDDDADEFLEFITNGVSRMYNLLNEVLDYSKIDGEIVNEPVDTNEAVTQAILNARTIIEEKNANVEVDNLPKILMSSTHILQLFQNLLVNGIKYNDKEIPQIKISGVRHSNNFIFSVKDNGIGIDEVYKDKIFDMFQRLHGKGEYTGTGIGLAICKKIVNQYNGEIWVESKLREGSTFFISLPCDNKLT